MLIQTLPTPIETLNLTKYMAKLDEREPDAWTPERLTLAAREYKRFLALKHLHPEQELVPTLIMDAMWHEHILDTRQYAADAEQIFGYFLHHCPEYPGENTGHDLDTGLSITARRYEEAFGELPAEMVVARCDGKKCHAPSSCRCR